MQVTKEQTLSKKTTQQKKPDKINQKQRMPIYNRDTDKKEKRIALTTMAYTYLIECGGKPENKK